MEVKDIRLKSSSTIFLSPDLQKKFLGNKDDKKEETKKEDKN